MKRISALILVLSMMFTLCGCGNTSPASNITIDDYKINVIPFFASVSTNGVFDEREAGNGYMFSYSDSFFGSEFRVTGKANSKQQIQSVTLEIEDCLNTDYFSSATEANIVSDIADVMNVPVNKLTVDIFFFFSACEVFAFSGVEATEYPAAGSIEKILKARNTPQMYDGWTYSFALDTDNELATFTAEYTGK